MENNYTKDTYSPPKILFNGHLETIYPALFRKVSAPASVKRIRITTPDDDFLDADIWEGRNEKAVIISHGLEGSSTRGYVKGMARLFFNNNHDVIAWNYRSCSGEMNLQPRFYHSGATEDLDTIVRLALQKYEDLILIGFSLGGNLTLKYLGETIRSKQIKKAVAISTPLDLHKGAINLSTPFNKIYEIRFLRSLKSKLKRKKQQYPDQIDLSHFRKVKTLFDFDDYYTSQLHGFENAMDYYQKCSSINFLEGIKIPTLILNAENDPMLTNESLDTSLADENRNIAFQLTKYGGHCGFVSFDSPYFWSEKRTLDFASS